MSIHLIPAMLAFVAIAHAAPESTVRPEDSPPQSAEMTDGTWRSYCAYRNDKVRFIFLSKHEFTVSKGEEPESGALHFAKGTFAKAHHVAFSPAEKGGDVLLVWLEGNLKFHYDLTRSRVFDMDFDVHGFSPIVRQIPVKLEPVTSRESLTKESAKVAAWLAAAGEEKKWEYTREKVPEHGYYTGKPVDPADKSIIWGEANEAGLRLGIGGLAQKAEIPAGQYLPVKQYIRNDGRETLRLSPTGFFNEGIEAELSNVAGAKFSMNRGYKAPMFFIRIRLEPGQFAELQSSPLQTILANKDGSPSTGQRAYTSGFVVSPGDYTLRLSHHVGKFAGKPMNAFPGDPRLALGLGEWIGTLQAAPISFRLNYPLIATGKPGSMVEIDRMHRIQFQKGQIVLSHRAGGMTHTHSWVVDAEGNWPTRGGTWKIADPGGDYLAAWDEGSTRLWYVDGTGIQRLDIAEQFVDAGHWTMAEAGGDLANMPDGVRQALKLPAKK